MLCPSHLPIQHIVIPWQVCSPAKSKLTTFPTQCELLGSQVPRKRWEFWQSAKIIVHQQTIYPISYALLTWHSTIKMQRSKPIGNGRSDYVISRLDMEASLWHIVFYKDGYNISPPISSPYDVTLLLLHCECINPYSMAQIMWFLRPHDKKYMYYHLVLWDILLEPKSPR